MNLNNINQKLTSLIDLYPLNAKQIMLCATILV